MRIRTRLLILILSILVPAFLAALLAVGYVYVEERRGQENGVRETVRVFALLVRNELGTDEAILQALARSPALAEGRLDEFQRHARALAPLRDSTIALYDAAGHRMLDTRVAPGQALPERRTSNIDALAQRLGADRTLVSDMVQRPDGSHRYVIQVPVHRAGRIVYFLSMSLGVARLQELLERQGFPDQWQAVIVDRQGRIIARLQEPGKFRGRLVRPIVLERFLAVTEGTVSATNLAGIPMHGFFNTVPDAGWRVMITIPQDELRRVPLHTAAFLGAIMALLLVLALAGARWFGGRAAAPIEYLGRKAEELGQGREVTVEAQGVREIDAVARRMAEASRQVLRAQGELERRVAEAVADSERAQHALMRGQKLEALGRLTGGIAHEFNNLLQTLTTALQMAALASNQPKVQSLLDTCRRTVGRATALTTRLGAFGRLQDAKLATVDPGEQVRCSVQLLGGVLRQGSSLDVDCADDLWPVTVDPLQFDLALLNLSINARDAMPGGGRLAIEARNVTLDQAPDLAAEHPPGDYVRVRVRDTGAGMPPEVLARALDPFFTTKAPGQGTGLGLAQAYAFATQSQGWLALASRVGEGTTVDIWLPRSDQPLTPQQPPARAGTAAPRGAGRVLFVEDDALVREAVVRGLEDAGFDVVVAPSGDAAVAMLERGLDVDVVFSDIVMPGKVSGIDLAAIVRERRPGLPVVLATGYTEQRAAIPGVQVLSKPYEIEQLVGLLARLATPE